MLEVHKMQSKDITVIGAAIVDVLAGPVDESTISSGSQPMKTIRMSFGGDALNEAVVLSRLGKRAGLVTKVGADEAGRRVLDYLRENGLSADTAVVEAGLATGINIVLFNESGERSFLTNPQGSLRKLSEKDVEPFLDGAADLVSFASMFVSPLLDIPAMGRIFRKIKSKPGRILAVDTTKAKNRESLQDIKDLLPYIDFFFPNEEEIALLTGEKDPYKNAELLYEAGVSCVAIKRGKLGCLLRYEEGTFHIPACRVEHCLDTTGAGDGFAAGFLWGISEGLPPAECARFACAAASCSVEKVGAVCGITSLQQVRQRYLSAYGKV